MKMAMSAGGGSGTDAIDKWKAPTARDENILSSGFGVGGEGLGV